MTDSKLHRPVHPEATHGPADADTPAADAASMRKRKPEEAAAQGEGVESAQVADAAVAAPADTPIDSAVDTPVAAGAGSDAAVTSGHGMAASGLGSTSLLTLGGLGALGLVAAAAGGGGGKSSTPVQPTQQLPDPAIPQPKPDTTKPDTTHPDTTHPDTTKPDTTHTDTTPPTAPSTPSTPEGQTPQTPAPVEPTTPDQTHTDTTPPTVPTTPSVPDTTPTVPTTPDMTQPPVPTTPDPVPPIVPTTPSVPDTTPSMPDTTPSVPDTTPTVPATPDTTPPSVPATPDPVQPPVPTTPSVPDTAPTVPTTPDTTPPPAPSTPDPVPPTVPTTPSVPDTTPTVPTTPDTTPTPAPTTPDPIPPTVPSTPEAPAPTPPAMPTVALASDSGTAGDGITNNGQVTVQVEAGNTWKYSLDNGATWTDGSGDHIDASALGADGDKQVLVVQTNAAHLPSDAAALHFTLDTAAAPVQLALKNDTGTVGDGISSDGTVSLTGLEDGATWRYSTDGGKTWNPGQGSEIADTRFEGKHEVQVIQTDKAGNESAMNSLAFTLDTGAPTLALKNDTGPAGSLANSDLQAALLHDGITNDGTLLVSGLRSGASWQYSLDKGAIWVDGAGSQIDAAALGADGEKTVWVKQIDASGESGYSTFTFTLDTTAPGALRLSLANDDGASGTDHVTSDPTIIVEGGEEGAFYSFYGYGATTHLFPGADSVVMPIASGFKYTLQMIQVDRAGNSGPTGSLEYEQTPLTGVQTLSGWTQADLFTPDASGPHQVRIFNYVYSEGDIVNLTGIASSLDQVHRGGDSLTIDGQNGQPGWTIALHGLFGATLDKIAISINGTSSVL